MRRAVWLALAAASCQPPEQTTVVIEPARVDFGRVFSPQQHLQPIQLRNTGDATALFATAESTDDVELQLTDARRRIEPGKAAAAFILLNATATLSSDVDVRLVVHWDNAPNVVLPVTAHEVFLDCRPSAPDVFDVGWGAVGRTTYRELTLVNTSAVAVTAALTISADVTAFGIEGDGSATLEPGTSHAFRVTFRPAAESDFIGQAIAFASDQCSGQPVTLTGTGIPSLLSCEVTPASCAPGLTCFTTLTVLNRAAQPVLLGGLQVSPAGELDLAGNGPLAVPGSHLDRTPREPGSLQVPVRFAPVDAGARSVRLTFTTSLPEQPTVDCTFDGWAGGPRLEVSTDTLDFGSLSAPATRTFTLRNAPPEPAPAKFGGADHLFILGFDARQLTPGPAGASLACRLDAPKVLGPGEQLSVPVTLTPLDAGSAATEWFIAVQTSDSLAGDAGVRVQVTR